jgi:hypothetical protein
VALRDLDQKRVAIEQHQSKQAGGSQGGVLLSRLEQVLEVGNYVEQQAVTSHSSLSQLMSLVLATAPTSGAAARSAPYRRQEPRLVSLRGGGDWATVRICRTCGA